MPVLRRDDSDSPAEIHYEEHGTGFPVLTLAPGGMRSFGDMWAKMPWNPVAELSGDYRVITMDQRNAGSSTAPITGDENWDTYAGDQIALLDHLGIDRCHVVGMCIGGAFILKLLTTAPERFARAVPLQPIGLDGNRQAFHDMFDGWAQEVRPAHPEAADEAWAAYRSSMYDVTDQLFTVPNTVLPEIDTPMLVLRGDDQYHPRSASELVAAQAPNARLIELWKDPEHLPAATKAIAEFLAAG